MLTGCARASKADGSQALDAQRDALAAAYRERTVALKNVRIYP